MATSSTESGLHDRPSKRKRPGERVVRPEPQLDAAEAEAEAEDGDEDGDEDIEFEDVAIPVPTVQTITRDSDDDEDDEDIQLEDVPLGDFVSSEANEDRPQELDLNLSAQRAAMSILAVPWRGGRRSAKEKKNVARRHIRCTSCASCHTSNSETAGVMTPKCTTPSNHYYLGVW